MHIIYNIFYSLIQRFELVKPTLSSIHLFGFAEYITALAVLLALFSMTNIRYRFRVSITPFIPIDKLAYFSFIFVGVATLVLEYCYAKAWKLPEIFANALNTQVALGVLFFAPVALWIYFAFINPPRFGRSNAKRYYDYITGIILRGTSEELPIIASEIQISAKNIIKHAKSFSPEAVEKEKPTAENLAYHILLLLGYKRFCQYTISSSPITAVALFSEITRQEAYGLPVNQLALNLFSEALINSDSILYHEDSFYESGLIGYYKPFSKSLFSDYYLVETLVRKGRTLFDINYKLTWTWNSDQIEAFCGCFLIFFEAYLSNLVTNKKSFSSIAFARGIKVLSKESGYHSARSIIDCSEDIRQGYTSKLSERVRCIGKALQLINNAKGLPDHRLISSSHPCEKDFYDSIVNGMCEIVFEASFVKEDVTLCWTVQHNIVFTEFFPNIYPENKIISHRLRRAVYNKIKELEKFPNYKSIRILGFFLNTMGLTLWERSIRNKSAHALHKAILSWTKNNFMKIVHYNEEIAEACLMGAVTFNKKQLKLVKTYHKDLRGNTPQESLNLIDSKFKDK